MNVRRTVVRGLSALAGLVLFLGCGSPSTSEDGSSPARRSAPEIVAQPAPAATAVIASVRPVAPSVPRLRSVDVEVGQLAAQVYLDPAHKLAHRKGCSEWTATMTRTPLAAARMQGYLVHAACENLLSVPEYRKQMVVDPQWVEYERRLAEYDVSVSGASTRQAVAITENVTASSESALATRERSPTSSGGEVHVNGYTRKDGTYVPPHTRSKPKK